MTCVTVCLDVGIADPTLSHGVLPVKSHVDGRLDRVAKLQFVGFNWDDLNEWHLFNKFLGALVVKAIFFTVPPGTLQVDSLDVASIVELLLDGSRAPLFRDYGVHDGLVQRPALGAAGSLHESGQVGRRCV